MNVKKWAVAAAVVPFIFLVIGVLLFAAMIFFTFMVQAEQEEPANLVGTEISELGSNEIPAQYLPIYQAAGQKYGIPWNLLAAVHRVETVFSTIPMESYAGAQGHMQFMPCTWTGWNHPSCSGLGAGNIPESQKVDPMMIKKYGGLGVDGNGDGKADPYDLTDAIFTAANYLSKNGAAGGDYRKAVFTYNHSEKYVADVLGFMKSYAKPTGSLVLTPGTGGFMRPLQTVKTSDFGMRFHPLEKRWKLHGGVDLDCVTGDPIPAAKAGVVTYGGWMDANNHRRGYGLYVWIDHGAGYKTTYAHLSSVSVKPGDIVQPGEVIGACGNTGGSDGDHLHFEIFKNGVLVDPAPYIGL